MVRSLEHANPETLLDSCLWQKALTTFNLVCKTPHCIVDRRLSMYVDMPVCGWLTIASQFAIVSWPRVSFLPQLTFDRANSNV